MFKKKKPEPEQPEDTGVIETIGKPPRPEEFDGFKPEHFQVRGIFEAEVCNLLLGINQRLDALLKIVKEE